jgi:asparagine synthase (glutamine-hydrolysing)
MPGIYGFVQKRRFDTDHNRALINAMRQSLEHMAEYESAVYACDWCGLGNTGLPVPGQTRFVADPSAGRAAAVSGYIYGWKNNSRIEPVTDPDLAGQLLRLPEENIETLVDGSFNIATVDLNRKVLHLVNDRFGHRQLYYLDTDDIFIFATEIKALMAYERFDRTLDQQAVFDYFNYTYPLGDRTFFKTVKLLPGAHHVTVRPSGAVLHEYWRYVYGSVSTASLPELIEEADSIYRDHIRRVIGDSRLIVLPLSGGLDSRFILSHAVQLGKTPHLFSHGAPGCNEEKIARTVAKAHGLFDRYTFVEVNPLWLVEYSERYIHLVDGMAHTDPCMLLGISDQYKLPRIESAFLNGIFGGPTNFGSGYFRDYDMAEPPDRQAKLKSIWGTMFGFSLSDQYYAMFHGDIRDTIKASHLGSIDREFCKYENVSEHFYNQKDVFMIKNRLTRFMNQVDCNRFGWNDHFALASDRLVDFYLTLPPELKLGRKFFVEYFKAKFPDMARITYQATGVNLYQTPSPMSKKLKYYRRRMHYYLERATRGKASFTDPDQYYHYDLWYRKYPQIRSFYENILLDERTFSRGLLDREGVEHALRRQREGGNGFYDISSLAGFEIFCRKFVDR